MTKTPLGGALLPQMPKKLLIYCGGEPFQYTLVENGEDWKKVFDSFEETVEYARQIVTSSTPLHIYDRSGRVLLRTTVPPVD